LILGGGYFFRSFGKSIDLLLVYGVSLVSGMLLSVIVFGSIYIFAFVFASLIGAVFFLCMLLCGRSYHENGHVSVPFISIYSLSTVLLLLLHPSKVIAQTVLFVFVVGMLIVTVFWSLGMFKWIVSFEHTKKCIPSVMGDTLLFFMLTGFGIFYSVSGNVIDYTLSSLHEPVERIVESENRIREDADLYSVSPVLPYRAIHILDGHREVVQQYGMNFQLLHDNFFCFKFVYTGNADCCYFTFLSYQLWVWNGVRCYCCFDLFCACAFWFMCCFRDNFGVFQSIVYISLDSLFLSLRDFLVCKTVS
jgi:hypothetical protein